MGPKIAQGRCRSFGGASDRDWKILRQALRHMPTGGGLAPPLQASMASARGQEFQSGRIRALPPSSGAHSIL